VHKKHIDIRDKWFVIVIYIGDICEKYLVIPRNF
jgi:hypothetical protein